MLFCNAFDCEKREKCVYNIINNPTEVYANTFDGVSVSVFDCSSFGGFTIDGVERKLCSKENGYYLFTPIQNVTVESLLSWIEKGKVTETGDYSKGWNDSIDSILDHMRLLGIKWKG